MVLLLITIQMKSTDKIWISWHCSRRTEVLAEALGLVLFARQIEGNGIKRHMLSTFWSFYILLRYRPKTIFLQYSFLLMIIIAIYKTLTFYSVTVISDCHTKAIKRSIHGPLQKLFQMLKRWSLGRADVLIVSNAGLVKDAKEYNPSIMIQPDIIPRLNPAKFAYSGSQYCIFVMSYAEDEPVELILQAAIVLADDMKVFLSGRAPNNIVQRFKNYPDIEFTGFLPDGEYSNLLTNASCIIALTNEDNCLQCAGYEALAVEVPLVTSDTDALRKYFGEAAIYVKHDVESLINGINRALESRNEYHNKLKTLKQKYKHEEEVQLRQLLERT